MSDVTVTLTKLEAFAVVVAARVIHDMHGEGKDVGMDGPTLAALGRAKAKFSDSAQDHNAQRKERADGTAS